MGRFQCVKCRREYYDRRFIWEPETEGGEAAEGCQEAGARGAAAVDTIGKGSGESDVDDGALGEGCHGGQPSSADAFDAMLISAPTADGDDDDPAGEVSMVTSVRTVADTVRATGTAANLTGAIAHGASAVCAPISSVAGVVGLTSGMSQLYQGLATASGDVDPHLVAKGSVTSSVGGTCMVLGACAAAAPPLFFVALGLGLAGLGAATVIDSTMDGLCPACRDEPGEGGEDSEDALSEDFELVKLVTTRSSGGPPPDSPAKVSLSEASTFLFPDEPSALD